MTGASQGYGLVLVILAGILAGSAAGPVKLMKRYQYEHWGFMASLIGMFVLPWVGLAVLAPGALSAWCDVPVAVSIRANLFSMAWGIANVLSSLCLVRIGFSLTVGLLTGIGLPIGVLTPILFRGTGMFEKAPSLFSPAGAVIGGGVVCMLAAVVLMTLAGFGRDAQLKHQPAVSGRRGSFGVGLAMAAAAGVLQAGLSFAFVYSQAPITEALQRHGAGPTAVGIGVWAFVLPGGVLFNVLFPLWVMHRQRSGSVLFGAGRDLALSLPMGVAFFLFVITLGQGMRLLGPLGASLGFGIYQALQILASQSIGWISGEWRGVVGKPRNQMLAAVALLIVAVVILAAGNAA